MIPAKRSLPVGVVPYGKSLHFTAKTLPEKLKSTHDLKAGTWGRLNVLAGSVTYFLEGEAKGYPIKTGETFVIAPQEKHHISVTEDAELFIQFCAKPKLTEPNPPASAPCFAHESELDDNGYMDWAKTHSD